MSLTATANYKDGKTYITAKENDPEVFFICNPVIDGNYSKSTNNELVNLTLTWITNKYINEYANIQLTNKVKEINEVIDQANDNIKEMANQSVLSQKIILDLLTLLYTKGLIDDEDFTKLTQ